MNLGNLIYKEKINKGILFCTISILIFGTIALIWNILESQTINWWMLGEFFFLFSLIMISTLKPCFNPEFYEHGVIVYKFGRKKRFFYYNEIEYFLVGFKIETDSENMITGTSNTITLMKQGRIIALLTCNDDELFYSTWRQLLFHHPELNERLYPKSKNKKMIQMCEKMKNEFYF